MLQSSKPEVVENSAPPSVPSTPQKPVNLLPEVPNTTSRKLTEREQRDCEVIGETTIIVF